MVAELPPSPEPAPQARAVPLTPATQNYATAEPTTLRALSQSGAPYQSTENPAPLRAGPAPKLPRLHWCAYKGDLRGILNSITDGCNIHETVSLRNQHGRLVCGITALFLAAQRGHSEIVKLLVDNGASPVQPCFIQGSTELCTPAEVASLNLHFKLSRYLKQAAKARRKEDEVLALDDDEAAPNSKLARELERARRRYSQSGGGAAPGSVAGQSGALGRLSQQSRTGVSVNEHGLGSMALGTTSQAGHTEVQPSVDGEVRAAALNFMQNVDLTSFDPTAEANPRVSKQKSGGLLSSLKRMVGGRRSDTGAGASSPVGASASREVQAAGGAGALSVDPARPDHTKVLQRFLKDLDLANWTPEHEAPASGQRPPPITAVASPGPGSTRGTSPGRGRLSPTRSTRSNLSPQRMRAEAAV